MVTWQEKEHDVIAAQFTAMACDCEVLFEHGTPETLAACAEIAEKEALRIERKYSRYLENNMLDKLNNSCWQAMQLDQETADLIEYATQVYEMSDGLFDITSGVLRHVWRFDGSDHLPDEQEVKGLLQLIGWEKIEWRRPWIRIPSGMELDLGGIGKEYAVDRVAKLLAQAYPLSALVNFGGDIAISRPRSDGSAWKVGIESPDQIGHATKVIELHHGGLATSGDSRRFVEKEGVRYSHVLNPKTGWPVQGAPHSVTVAAPSCTQAGTLATLALLQGLGAEKFLAEQHYPYWCLRENA